MPKGRHIAVEWTDANPFEPTRIRVEARDVARKRRVRRDRARSVRDCRGHGRFERPARSTVVDKADRFVGGLDAASFRVAENDEPQTINLVRVESLPVTYALLVDASQSMHARMDFVRAAARRLADFLRPNDRVIVAPFAQSLGAITGPTGDRETIAGAVRRSRPEEARRFPTASSRPRASWQMLKDGTSSC